MLNNPNFQIPLTTSKWRSGAAALSAAVLGMSAFVPAQASELDIALSEDSVAVDLRFLNEERSLRSSAGIVYREGGSRVFDLELLALGQTAIGNLPTTVGIGGQLDLFNGDDLEGGALPIGGFVQFNIPQVPGLGYTAAAFVAPSITAFGDADRFWRFDTKVTYRIIRAADVYLGYRHLHAKAEEGSDVSLEESFHLGFRLQF
ncbi:YfaZ family outer membrane protein [Allohahella marinimesophila]|uniref:YfaZ n=1 Tax=Allohahella marinimesophila TaxID=1054972 RepID=A0ABP7PYC5_9GAMM